MPFRIDRLAANHRYDTFDSGVPVLDDWLRRYAGQSRRADMAVTYVAHVGGEVIGYYAIVASEVASDEAPPELARKAGRHPIPVVRLVRLAVDRHYRGRGLGAGLLRDALLRGAMAAELIGARAVVVDAKDDAVTFYTHFDFAPFPDQPTKLFLSMRTLRDAIGFVGQPTVSE
jgi:GNAT superfamily N-acetyltransferase